VMRSKNKRPSVRGFLSRAPRPCGLLGLGCPPSGGEGTRGVVRYPRATR
jgi:hypothetical protein